MFVALAGAPIVSVEKLPGGLEIENAYQAYK